MLAQPALTDAALSGTITADRSRIEELLSWNPPVPDPKRWRLASMRDLALYGGAVLPSVRIVHNSDIPYGGNDGPMWAGRGLSTSVTAGIAAGARYRWASLDLVGAPTVTHSENRPFTFLPGREPNRSAYSSPWHLGASSADLPLRFGDRPITRVTTGESSATLALGPIAGGVSSASEWWGPGIRNTLVLSSNAAGIPRGFISTSRPLRSRIGWTEAYGFAGMLAESRFFDDIRTNNHRSVSGFRVAYRPAIDSGLTLGIARVVNVPIDGRESTLPHVLDAIIVWEPLAAPGDTLIDGTSKQRADQLMTLFFRWRAPDSGFETYAEWAVMENPRSLADWLAAPHHTQGYTLGLQWVGESGWRRGRLRVHAEVTYLEQTQHFPDRPPPDFYTGRATAHGWTNEGQILGAAIGPGSSSQFVGFDWLAPTWQVGAFVGRTRWENDALYRQPFPRPTQHDVTIHSGLRGGVRLPWYDVGGEITIGRRHNYLFQNEAYTPSERFAIDVQNTTVSMSLTPRR